MDEIELVNKEMIRRGYSVRTIKSYTYCLKRFLIQCNKEPRKISKKDVKDYIEKLTIKDRSGSTLNVNLQAIKFFLENILNKHFFVNIKYSRLPRKLPVVLSKEEVARLISSIKNKKHKLMIKLMYSAGLRVSELINLRVRDLDFSSNYGWVRKGKGNKDRLFIIADSLKKDLILHIKETNLNEDSWLFQSYDGRMSIRTPQVIVKRAAKICGIKKDVHCHTLRHSYATHLIENGYDVASVQSLLGHNSMETTMIYVHMTSPKMIGVKSPLDSLQLEGEDKKSENENKKTQEEKDVS